jgi:hypothetical protein
MVLEVKDSKMRKDLELLYKLKFTHFQENLNAIAQARGDVEGARKILVQKDSLKQSRSSYQQNIAKS